MSKYKYEGYGVVRDTEIDFPYHTDDIVELLDEKDQNIANLEAKLAEIERKNFELLTKLNLKEYAPAFCTLADRDCEALRQIEKLKHQLAEKERQVKKLNLEAQKYFEDAYCNDFHNQDKISFCIEKFQETKKSLRDKVCLMENDTHYYLQNAIHWQDVVAIIDNQIASLKKGVE